jgi:HEAT repeat protein
MTPPLILTHEGSILSVFRILMQFGIGWRLDLGSLFIGLLLGVLLMTALRRLWPVLNRWQRQVSSRFQQSVAWARSETEVRFRSEMAEYVQRHHLGKAWANLDQVFVSPRLIVPAREIEPEDEADRGAGLVNYLWPELMAGIATPMPPTIELRELLLSGQRTLVSAAPGAGKTTVLAHSAYQCATATPDGPDAELQALIPVFVHLAELDVMAGTPSDMPPEMDPAVPLVEALRSRSTPLTSPGIKDLLSQKLQAGQLLLLIDGWNEVPHTSWTPAMEWLGRLLSKFPEIRVVMAAPLTGYGPLLELGFDLVGILPWRPGQLDQFGSRWTQAIPLSQSPSLRQYWQPGQSSLECSLRFWLRTVLEEQNGKHDDWPRRISDLLVDSLALFGPDDGKMTVQSELSETTKACWQRLAYALVAQEKSGLSKAEVQTLLKQVLAESDAAESSSLSRLQGSIAKSSLLVTWANGRTSFLSTVCRDFLAASYMARRNLTEAATDYLKEPHRADLLRFYVGQVGAAEMANEVLASEDPSLTREGLFQVASWMSEALDGGEWRRQTMVQLGQIIRQTSFANVLRQRAVAALAQSREPGVLTFLLQLLERSDPFLRQIGTAALSCIGVDEAIEPLKQMLKDDDALVRQAAVRSLAWLNDPEAERPLLMTLIGSDHLMSRIAAESLAQNGPDGVEILHEAVEDSDLHVRRSGVHGLSLLDGSEIERKLVNIEHNDPEWLVRSAASEALETIRTRAKGRQWRQLPLRKHRWLIQYAAQKEHNVPDGAAILPFLVRAVAETSQARSRAAAAASLGHMAAREAWPALVAAIRDKDELVREAAFAAICRIYRAYGDRLTPKDEA